MVATKPDRLTLGPGSELRRLLPRRWNVAECGCDYLAYLMDFWGPDGCESRLEEIVSRLVAASRKIKSLSRIPREARSFAARRLVKVAIRRARRRSHEVEPVPPTMPPKTGSPVFGSDIVDPPHYEQHLRFLAHLSDASRHDAKGAD